MRYVPPPPNGFKKARYLFTKSPDLKNNFLYNLPSVAINKVGVVLKYSFRSQKWKERKVTYKDSQYPTITLQQSPYLKTNNKLLIKNLRVHKLVYFTFADVDTTLDYNKYELNHIDHNKQNPKFENLELVTPSENQIKYNIFSKGGNYNSISTTIPSYDPNKNQYKLDL